MAASTVPNVTLNDGNRIPQLGFGVFKVPDDETQQAVERAFEAGYRSIDTASLYKNERGVGAAIKASGLPRDELFITSKVWNDAHGREKAARAFDESLERLGLDYLDLFLIHWPVPKQDLYVETWQTLTEIQKDGRVKSIGVSNFEPNHLDRLKAETGVIPTVNQVELHPYLTQSAVREYGAANGIVTESWSPLAKGGDLLKEPVLTEIGQRHGKTPAQVVVRWHLQLGCVVIPKTVTPARVTENFDVFDFELTDADLKAVSALDRDGRTGPHPNEL